jgi:hypothetical protein
MFNKIPWGNVLSTIAFIITTIGWAITIRYLVDTTAQWKKEHTPTSSSIEKDKCNHIS